MPATPHHFQGEALLLDPAGALVWPRARLLAIADLHLEKGSAAAARGQLLPPWDSALTLARLAALIATYAPLTIVAVGDSFHDDRAASRLGTADLAILQSLTAEARFIWVRGNHDPSPPEGLEGESTPEHTTLGITFRHEARAGATAEISGHFHPKARIATRAALVSRACFMASPHRIMLPSFGAYTGGLDVLHPAIARHFPQGGHAHLLGQNRTFCFAVPAPDQADPALPLAPCPAPQATQPLATAAPNHKFN